MRVLLLEDEPVMRRAISRELSRRGYSVTEAPSATAALGCTGPYDCGVFDIVLPDGDGIEVAETLLESGAVGCAVFYSGTSDERIWLRASDGGVFVHKDAGVQRLADQLDALVSPQSSNSPSSAE
ncbi:MAG: response regulator [Polyangiaceae bacterium]